MTDDNEALQDMLITDSEELGGLGGVENDSIIQGEVSDQGYVIIYTLLHHMYVLQYEQHEDMLEMKQHCQFGLANDMNSFTGQEQEADIVDLVGAKDNARDDDKATLHEYEDLAVNQDPAGESKFECSDIESMAAPLIDSNDVGTAGDIAQDMQGLNLMDVMDIGEYPVSFSFFSGLLSFCVPSATQSSLTDSSREEKSSVETAKMSGGTVDVLKQEEMFLYNEVLDSSDSSIMDSTNNNAYNSDMRNEVSADYRMEICSKAQVYVVFVTNQGKLILTTLSDTLQVVFVNNDLYEKPNTFDVSSPQSHVFKSRDKKLDKKDQFTVSGETDHLNTVNERQSDKPIERIKSTKKLVTAKLAYVGSRASPDDQELCIVGILASDELIVYQAVYVTTSDESASNRVISHFIKVKHGHIMKPKRNIKQLSGNIYTTYFYSISKLFCLCADMISGATSSQHIQVINDINGLTGQQFV